MQFVWNSTKIRVLQRLARIDWYCIYLYIRFSRFDAFDSITTLVILHFECNWMQLTCHFGPYRNCPNCSKIDRNDFTFLQYSHHHGYGHDKHIDFLGTKIQFLQSWSIVFWVSAIYTCGFSKVENEMRNGFQFLFPFNNFSKST